MAIDIIGINNFLNLILVNEYIKPTFLLPESNCNSTTHPNILSEITKEFPHLKQSINYNLYDGIIISYNDYNNYTGDSVSLPNIGVLPGYPFYENFNNITDNYNSYTINVNVKLENGLTTTLFTNKCQHITEYSIESFNIFIENAMDAFYKEKYIQLLGEFAVIDVHTEIIPNISSDIIIQKLINNITLQPCDFDTIQHILFNLDFSHNFQVFFNLFFQDSNKIHKGILIGILLTSKHYLLSPFDDIQNNTEKYNHIKCIVTAWETNLTHIIKQTACK